MASRFTEVRLAAGEVLITAGELGEELFLVESGTLDVMANVAGRIVAVGQVLPGQAVGEMQFVLGGRRTATVRASTPVVAFRLARNDFEELQRQWPALHGNLLSLTRERIYRSQLRGAVSRTFADAPPAFAEELERVAEWVELRCGDVLFREGDAADGWYLIVTGRLRVIKEANGSSPARILQEAGAAESLGEMAILSGAPRAATVVALRDSLVARIPTEDCLRIAQGHPQLLLAISRTLISRLHTPTQSPRRIDRLVVALLHTTRNPILDSFARDFSAALRRIRPTAHVTPAMLTETGVLGEGARLDAGHPSWLRFRGWLESVLLDEPFVVLDLGPDESVAAEHMIGQADHVVLLGDASSKIEHSEVVQGVFAAGTPRHYRRHHTLVLVHPAGTRHPRGPRAWLDTCNVDRHLHVRVDRAEDAARVARALTGRSIGVVLGGGGARGFAHLGVIRAFRELGLPVDYVGGTSMGSIMAGQVALGLNHEELVALNRPIVALRPFNEYTVPVVALLKTEKIAQSAKMAFGDTLIEDLWLPYFAVSANLTTATPCIHESGPTWLATRASGSLPGIAVPVVQNRELLVDGGIVDNLPVGIMHDRCGGGPVIAVDVSPAEDLRMTRDAFPSQWALLGERIRPGARSKELPSIADILMRTTLLASAAQRERSWREADLVLNPPIEAFGMLAFEQLDTLVEIGYQHAMSKAEQIRALIV
jgi:predicted acylesterase/phospholipase RssA/CRP-like cAMP-binding protein